MNAIPDRERGYSIEPDTGTVHERHQDHAPLARRTSAKGVSAYLKGREPVPCQTCFPVKPKRGAQWREDPPRYVLDEDVEDAPVTAALIDDMVDAEPRAE